MESSRRVQIHQYNDPEILEFLNEHGVRYRLLGDHLFVIRSRGQDVAARPGDWLRSTADDEVDVQRGDFARRAQRAIDRTRRARVNLPQGLVPESDTEQWKRRVEAEARHRLRRSIHDVAHRD